MQITSVADQDAATGEVREGRLECTRCHATVPVVRSLPRFVPSESYASTFGFQWNRFDRIQIDKFMHNDLSRDRFYATTGWPARLEGQRILEAGCGAGRFTQLALETGAEIFSFDLSSAVDAAWRNNTRDIKAYRFSGQHFLRDPVAQGSVRQSLLHGSLAALSGRRRCISQPDSFPATRRRNCD